MYTILEVASTHGGSLAYLEQLLSELSRFNNCGIKFQPFKYDMLAHEDYRGYNTYRKLFFPLPEWKKIITTASKTKEVWLDLFDEYSLSVLKDNFEKIRGIKIQASVLGNHRLFSQLEGFNLKDKICILSVAAHTIEEIGLTLRNLQEKLECEFVLQIGFQSHPTEFLNSGLSKLPVIHAAFPGHRISFADHLENGSPDVLFLPFIAHLMGAAIIEKHVMCEHLPTEFDHYSSVTHVQLDKFFEMANRYTELLKQPFINNEEKQYLDKSLLVPMLTKARGAGRLLSVDDFEYKRSSRKGLNTSELRKRISEGYILATDLATGDTVKQENLKQATIGAVVVCRMKSTRLPKKALSKIGDLTSIELCIKNILQFEHVNKVILATSTHPDDSVLRNYTYSQAVGYFEGSEDDVIDRLIKIADLHALDIIVRVTGDSPFRSNEVFQILRESHFRTGADYTAANNAAIGTNTEIINVQALRKVVNLFGGAPYSEYMSYYFKNNPEHFKLNIVELPVEYTGNFRLTLDYEEDLQLFREIEKEFAFSRNEFNTHSLFRFLENNPKITAINSHCEVAYKPDSELMNRIISYTTLKK